MTLAKVIETTDGNEPLRLQDEYGTTWTYAVDAADGTIAVQTDADYPPRAGVASWNGDGTLAIAVASDGDHYGVNCTEEYTAADGKWELTEEIDV